MNDIFIDSNIILYLMDCDERKRDVAQALLISKPVISAQVLAEVANVCKRRFKYDKESIMNLWTDLISDCYLMPAGISTIQTSIALCKRYNFQIFDAMVIASAIEAGCTILYSEDMQHKLVVENKLTIINPFV